jgi:hypothetical protein
MPIGDEEDIWPRRADHLDKHGLFSWVGRPSKTSDNLQPCCFTLQRRRSRFCHPWCGAKQKKTVATCCGKERQAPSKVNPRDPSTERLTEVACSEEDAKPIRCTECRAGQGGGKEWITPRFHHKLGVHRTNLVGPSRLDHGIDPCDGFILGDIVNRHPKYHHPPSAVWRLHFAVRWIGYIYHTLPT